MTNLFIERCRQVHGLLLDTDADVITFDYGGRWYELGRNRSKPKPICGARKKTGERCRCKSLHRGNKCKWHGGLSTGARTPEGKARAIQAMRAGYAKWLSEKNLYAQAHGRVKSPLPNSTRRGAGAY